MAPKTFRRLLSIFSQRLFSRVSRSQVEYGQTLSKKRKKNCILKSVSSLSSLNGSSQMYGAHSLSSINFEFSRRPTRYRGSVRNFQKIDPTDMCCVRKCCEKCFCSETMSQSSISSDSACDVTSTSSCDDLNCKFRKKRRKKKRRAGPSRKKSVGTVENFIKIHSENFGRAERSGGSAAESIASEDHDEPDYETLSSRVSQARGRKEAGTSLVESDYDILLAKCTYSILEPKYENLKRVENLYESPASLESCISTRSFGCSDTCPFNKIKDLVHSNRTYDEVIESLKLLHMKSHGWAGGSSVEKVDNEVNSILEQKEGK